MKGPNSLFGIRVWKPQGRTPPCTISLLSCPGNAWLPQGLQAPAPGLGLPLAPPAKPQNMLGIPKGRPALSQLCQLHAQWKVAKATPPHATGLAWSNHPLAWGKFSAKYRCLVPRPFRKQH